MTKPPLRLQLRLYLAGDAPNSLAALANLRAALAGPPVQLADLEVIDVLAEPARGLADGVLMMPMLVRLSPAPQRRMLGNLGTRSALLGVLALDEIPDD